MPVAVDPAPAAFALEPVAVDPNPFALELMPVAVDPTPLALAPNPTAVDDVPPALELAPKADESVPEAVELLPTAVEREALAVASSPIAVDPGSVANAPVPTDVCARAASCSKRNLTGTRTPVRPPKIWKKIKRPDKEPWGDRLREPRPNPDDNRDICSNNRSRKPVFTGFLGELAAP